MALPVGMQANERVWAGAHFVSKLTRLSTGTIVKHPAGNGNRKNNANTWRAGVWSSGRACTQNVLVPIDRSIWLTYRKPIDRRMNSRTRRSTASHSLVCRTSIEYICCWPLTTHYVRKCPRIHADAQTRAGTTNWSLARGSIVGASRLLTRLQSGTRRIRDDGLDKFTNANSFHFGNAYKLAWVMEANWWARLQYAAQQLVTNGALSRLLKAVWKTIMHERMLRMNFTYKTSEKLLLYRYSRRL